MRRLILAISLCFIGSAPALEPSNPGLVKSEFLFEKAPFPSCHASTIAKVSGGGLVAAWFGGTAEGKPDVGIWLSRTEAGAWSAPVEVANGAQPDGKRWPCWNPVLFQPREGPLMLFYKVGQSWLNWFAELRTSADGGRTWSSATRLPEGYLGPIKNKPVQLSNGDILCPSSTEQAGWRVHFERTPDLGKTWTKTEPVNDGKSISAIQPSILSAGDRLIAVGRTRQQRLFRTASDDLGKTWAPLALTELPNPNSGTDAVTLNDGRHLLVYNHAERGRSPLNVAVSKGAAGEWRAALVLESGPGEFSYPAVIQTADGLVHAVYTWKRQRIKHIAIDPNKLETQPIVKGLWPKLDEIDEVKALLKAQMDAWNKGDLDGFMAGYWNSPELTFVSGGTVTKGWEATAQRYRKRYKADGAEMGQLAFGDIEVTREGDELAIARGRWDLKFAKSKDLPGGRFTLLVRKKPEGWRVTYDHTSVDDSTKRRE